MIAAVLGVVAVLCYALAIAIAESALFPELRDEATQRLARVWHRVRSQFTPPDL